jgi:hypothetical protein
MFIWSVSRWLDRVNSPTIMTGPLWPWSYVSWIYDYLCNQCHSPLTLWVRTPLGRGVLNTTLCYKVCQWLVPGHWFSPGTPVSSTNKTDLHDITAILLKVVLNNINPPSIMNTWKQTEVFIVKKTQKNAIMSLTTNRSIYQNNHQFSFVNITKMLLCTLYLTK